ncbi:MAG: hypothetical protein K2Y39_17520 [Candidatus Obscuribacterales bacterium]|nr:hypothetical protein [Candidatus Obscuribacterales bacterium]
MPTGGESIVALEHLDSHIKAILKLKLRAFVHLNPCFESMHSIDASRGLTHTMHRTVETPELHQPVSPQTQPLLDFPPIPAKESPYKSAEFAATEQFSPNLPYSIDQASDCPNRMPVSRLRRRARV